MTWIIAGLLAPFLWAVTNLIDQLSIRKYFSGSPLFITTVGCFLSIFAIIFFTIYDISVWSLEASIALIFVATAFFDCFTFLAYYRAIEKDDASNAIPLFQILPVFIFILAFIFLGETIEKRQIIGAGLIILGAISLLIDFKNKTYNKHTLFFMMLCCSGLAITTIFDRYALDYTNWYTAMAWKSVGYFLFSSCIFICIPQIRRQCITIFRNPYNVGLACLSITEIFAISANTAFIFSLEKAPSAGLAQTLNGFQPVYILLLGYFSYRLFPDIFHKPKEGKHLGFHIVCLTFMLFGLYLLY